MSRVARLMAWIEQIARSMARSRVQLHAGGIVYRKNGRKPVVLIVTARGSRRRWVLPKGRVKRGESSSAAALREVKEEAGVAGRVREVAGIAEYRQKARRVRVEYHLIEYTRPIRRPADEDEERKVHWCAVEDAIGALTYASARRILLEAHPRIVELLRRRS